MDIQRILFLMALTGGSAGAFAAEQQMPAPTTAMFVNEAVQGGMTEVALGKIAIDKSKDVNVQHFAERMVADHGKADAELAALAKAKGIDAPKQLDAKHQAMVNSMQGKEGADFDSAYSKHMNMDHSKALALFEGASRSSDADVAKFAAKTLPALKEHKEMAEKLPGNKASY